MLEQQELLEFNLGTLTWKWDLSKIERETASTDNVVALVSKKIAGLEPDLAKMLQLAALLGSEFQDNALALVWKEMGYEETNLKELLTQASEHTFFESAGPTALRWVHDKIQEATLSLIPKSELAGLKFRIGTILLRGLDREDREAHYSFLIVDLLDASVDPDASVHLEIARLKCQASRKAMELSAYQSASKYIQTGIKHLPKDGWKSYYELALSLHSTGAEVEGILAKTEEMQFYISHVQDHAKTLMDKMPCYLALADRMGTDSRMKESNELALHVLSKLGVTFPRNGAAKAFRAISGVFATKKQLASLDVDSLSVMTEPYHLASMRLLSSVVSSSYLLLDNFLFLLSVVRMVQLTIQYGVCDESLPALATFGVCVSSVLGDFKTGSKYAAMALGMLGPTTKASESKVIFRTWTFVLNWTNPVNDSLKAFLEGYKSGMLMGDTESATYCMFGYCWGSFYLSKPLRTVDDDCRIYMAQMKDLGRMEAAEGTNNVWQAVLYLRDQIDTENCEIFTDLEGAKKAFQPSRSVCRSLLFAILGDYESGAQDALKLGGSELADAPGANVTLMEPFFRSISLYAMAHRTRKAQYKRHARKARKVVQTRLTKGNPNVIHQAYILDAEDAALCGKNYTKKPLF
uniref:Uncharacterized protein n=1 Tax=Amphora coffeiformis TaxID=265554 RepID=A0A7S3P7X1_9STRA|mmetsp:Transcript_14884/g.28417  ORF Transcript_14884/g.28417 Transcript_14884/m.28417 type:complete len:635 (-) Transcript_14884:237-2141(-)